ncbi:adenine phosphoribosyltransferase [uncultured Aquimonas sp.]|uniref:adenine phosphoribosyltransferase n=1 Tax=uncultured Aquimonas sp. TaxID=385483 RepID=UPI000869BA97|nr:adenine phosphoribosyltransferase [uncultured Aquimonas sp.]ODU45226.1 MAG: adenine phosphoribosyltransferase [Xanthomonadaceae bacterium SCN 69-123]
MTTLARIESLIRPVPDFPKPGILFRDITPLLADAEGFRAAVDALLAPWRARPPQVFCGVESRGFIFAAAMAQSLGCGFAPIRKPGKLPGPVLREHYSLEYGEDMLELRADALQAGSEVVVIDDVLATGGTLAAAARLVERSGARLVGAGVLIELVALQGRERLAALPALHSVLRY